MSAPLAGGRIAIAIPGIALAIGAVALGGPAFAGAAAVFAIVGLYEFYNLTAGYRPLRWAGYLSAILMIGLAALTQDPERGVLAGVGACLGLVAVAGLMLARREEMVLRMGITTLGAIYLGAPLALLVAARELPEGAGAVANVLVGVWVFDTASFFGGRLWGQRQIAPLTSPGKTVEGFAIGLVAGVLAVLVAGLYMDWISALESLLLGIVICLAAFVGDLFESMIKRDIGTKDSGRLLLGHGGVLDRFDSLLFAAVAAYFVTVVVVL